MSKKSLHLGQRKTGSLLQYLMLTINMLVGILFTPFIVRKLGKAEYGLYQLVASFAGYLAVLDFGIGTTLTRYSVKFRSKGEIKKEENYLFMSLMQTLCFSAGVLIIGGILYFFLDDIFSASLTAAELHKAHYLYILMVINVSVTLIDHYFWGTHCSREQFIYNTGEKIIRILLRMALISILLINGMDSVALIAVDLFLTVVMLICDMFYSFGFLKIKIRYHNFDKALFKESFLFAFFIFLQAIVNQITMNTDKFILGIMTSTSMVAVYAVAMQIFTIYNSLSTAIQSVFLPKATKLVHTGADKGQLTDFVIKPARVQFMILGITLVGFLLIGKEFVRCWMGKDFLSAYMIALIIMIPGTVELSQNVIVSVVLAKNKNGFRTTVMAGVAVFNVVLTVFLIKLLGYMGAPIATAVSYLIGNIIIMNIYYKKVIDIDIFRFAVEVLRGTGAALVITGVVSYFLIRVIPLSGWAGVAVKALIITAIYAALMLLFGFNAEESGYIRKILGRSKIER